MLFGGAGLVEPIDTGLTFPTPTATPAAEPVLKTATLVITHHTPLLAYWPWVVGLVVVVLLGVLFFKLRK